ncbi:DUF3299 domain-containing protein [Silanimonas lenta]|uniref:DUF3299 domain-containing protein n=1 Tax=Silanimonas lenta TaxID=265429 RepID=UPI00042A04F1|nr:DUF3299 domain-containing protein [Silanimonas lenta]
MRLPFALSAASVLAAALLLGASLPPAALAQAARPGDGLAADAAVREIDWLELLPPEDLKALEEMPEIDHSGQMQMPQVMSSTKTVPAMNGVRGKVPGYLVPIAFDDQQRVTEMFLVPYFGACIHVPPPPPNQLIYIKPKHPVELGQLWDAYWVHGTLRTELVSNAMATSAYAMDLERLELMTE